MIAEKLNISINCACARHLHNNNFIVSRTDIICATESYIFILSRPSSITGYYH